VIGLYRGISLKSRVIRRWTWGEYSHASWIEGTPEQPGEVYEAWTGGCRHLPNHHVGHRPGTVIDLFDVELTWAEHEELIRDFVQDLGKPYDYWALVGFVTHRRSEDPTKWICSEWVFARLKGVGVTLQRMPAWKVSPAMLAYSPLVTPAGTLVV